MTTGFAIGVLVLAAGCGLAFLWWMFSGAAGWLDRDDEPPTPPTRASGADPGESHDD